MNLGAALVMAYLLAETLEDLGVFDGNTTTTTTTTAPTWEDIQGRLKFGFGL